MTFAGAYYFSSRAHYSLGPRTYCFFLCGAAKTCSTTPRRNMFLSYTISYRTSLKGATCNNVLNIGAASLILAGQRYYKLYRFIYASLTPARAQSATLGDPSGQAKHRGSELNLHHYDRTSAGCTTTRRAPHPKQGSTGSGFLQSLAPKGFAPLHKSSPELASTLISARRPMRNTPSRLSESPASRQQSRGLERQRPWRAHPYEPNITDSAPYACRDSAQAASNPGGTQTAIKPLLLP